MEPTTTILTQSDMAEITDIAARARQAINLSVERELRLMNEEIDKYLRGKLREVLGITDEQRKKTKLKFGPLFEYFRNNNEKEFTLTFDEIGEIIGQPLSDSAYKYREYWSRYGRSRLGDCWYANGYKIKTLDLDNKYVSFYRINPYGSRKVTESDAA